MSWQRLNKLRHPIAVACLVTVLASSSGLDALNYPSDLPLRYRNKQSGLTMSLPASWQGYLVVSQQWESTYPPADKPAVIERGPEITLRSPQWTAAAPYQDIPILVFTRSQWDGLHRGEVWPSLYAGGVMEEMWHNEKYVFAISSRYNADDSVKGWKEVTDIVERNRAVNKMPPLYPE